MSRIDILNFASSSAGVRPPVAKVMSNVRIKLLSSSRIASNVRSAPGHAKLPSPNGRNACVSCTNGSNDVLKGLRKMGCGESHRSGRNASGAGAKWAEEWWRVKVG